MTGPRVFFVGGLLSYRALFSWIRPSVYIPTMLISPVFQTVFFTLLGRYSGVADDTHFVVGNAILACAMAGVFGMVMSLGNEREFGTLSAVLATPANRFALFCGRAWPVVANGVFVSAVSFTISSGLLGVTVPPPARPGIALTGLITAASCAMFGLALGSVGLRVRDLWVGSNLAYYLLLLLCGANVPLSVLPGWLAAVARLLPLTHGIEAAGALAAGGRLSDVVGLLTEEFALGLAYGGLGYGLLRFFEAEGRREAVLDRL
jgi:ABC-2 type transport system permease protein